MSFEIRSFNESASGSAEGPDDGVYAAVVVEVEDPEFWAFPDSTLTPEEQEAKKKWVTRIVTEKDWTQDAEHFFWDVNKDFDPEDEDGDSAFVQVGRHWPWDVCLYFSSGGNDRELSAGEVAMVHGLITRINEARYSEGASA